MEIFHHQFSFTVPKWQVVLRIVMWVSGFQTVNQKDGSPVRSRTHYSQGDAERRTRRRLIKTLHSSHGNVRASKSQGVVCWVVFMLVLVITVLYHCVVSLRLIIKVEEQKNNGVCSKHEDESFLWKVLKVYLHLHHFRKKKDHQSGMEEQSWRRKWAKRKRVKIRNLSWFDSIIKLQTCFRTDI